MNRDKAIPTFQELIAKQLIICNVVLIIRGRSSSQDHFKHQITSGFESIFISHKILYKQEFIIVIIIYSRIK